MFSTYVFCNEAMVRIHYNICLNKCDKLCKAYKVLTESEDFKLRIQNKVYNEKFNSDENRELALQIFIDFKFTKDSMCPPSWAEEVYDMLKDMAKLHPEIQFVKLDEKNGNLILEYELPTKDEEIEKLISYTTYRLCQKGVMFKESVRRL